MTRLRILLNLRTAVFLASLAGMATVVGVIVWANHTGLPDQWRRAIEHEMAKQGTIARIGSLRYSPIRGVIARDVQIFAPARPEIRTAHFEQIVLGLDRTKMLRGIVRIEKIELSDARVSLPTTAGAPDLVIEHLHGRALVSSGRVIEVREARGMIGGVALDFGARLLGYRPYYGEHRPDDQRIAARRLLLARIAGEIGRWDFDPAEPPRIRLFLEGELDDPEGMRVELGISARHLGRGDYRFARVELDGEILAGLLSLDSLRASDQAGTLEGRLDFDLNHRRGRFLGRSNLDALRLVRSFSGIRALADFSFDHPPAIEVDGSFALNPDQPPQWSLVGTVASGPFRFRDQAFDQVTTSFGVTGRDFYLHDLQLQHRQGTARGKVLARNGHLRYQVTANVPVDPWRPFFAGEPFGRILDTIEARDDHRADVDLEGTANLDDPLTWSCAGTVHAANFRYHGVPLHEFAARLSLDQLELRFDDVLAVFDDRSYPLRRSTPGRPTARARNVTIDRPAREARVDQLTGSFWPAQAAALFNAELAAQLEAYRFHAPPETRSNGTIDLRPGSAGTDFLTDMRLQGGAEYQFLGQLVPVTNPTGRIRVRGNRVEIAGLKLATHGGRIAGNLDVAGGNLQGEFHWTHLSLPEIARTYRFEHEGGGLLTGRLAFTGPTTGIGGLDGTGELALTDGELFAVPIFGPLSPLIGGVLGDRRAGFEHARDAFCTFVINDGILTTRDFQTETPSVAFTGDGTVNLATKLLDLTVRLDARGLLGVITLPLRPFQGLFQFRGTGPLNKPEWHNVIFTSPENGPTARRTPPKARPVDPAEVAPPPKAHPVDPTNRPAATIPVPKPDRPAPAAGPRGRP